jgi:hypothetical protein
MQRFCKDWVSEMENILLSLADTCRHDVDLGATGAASACRLAGQFAVRGELQRR